MDVLEKHIIRRLYDHTYIGRRHTAIEHLKQGLPSDQRDMSVIFKTVRKLVQGGWLLIHHGQKRVSLNPSRLKEAREIAHQ